MRRSCQYGRGFADFSSLLKPLGLGPRKDVLNGKLKKGIGSLEKCSPSSCCVQGTAPRLDVQWDLCPKVNKWEAGTKQCGGTGEGKEASRGPPLSPFFIVHVTPCRASLACCCLPSQTLDFIHRCIFSTENGCSCWWQELSPKSGAPWNRHVICSLGVALGWWYPGAFQTCRESILQRKLRHDCSRAGRAMCNFPLIVPSSVATAIMAVPCHCLSTDRKRNFGSQILFNRWSGFCWTLKYCYKLPFFLSFFFFLTLSILKVVAGGDFLLHSRLKNLKISIWALSKSIFF